MATLTAAQVRVLRRFAAEEAARTRQGRRWLELLREHQQEVFQRYAASPTLRQHIDRASREAALLIESLDSERPRVIDQSAMDPVEAALAELDARGSAGLRGATAEIRQDLQSALGKTVLQVLGPRQG
jgi:hypothetical protein